MAYYSLPPTIMQELLNGATDLYPAITANAELLEEIRALRVLLEQRHAAELMAEYSRLTKEWRAGLKNQ